MFENYAQEHQVLNDPIFFRDTSGHHSEAAYVTELGHQIVVPLGPAFSFHVGYEVYFIDRIALAPDQYDFNVGNEVDGTRVNNRGDMVLQGVNLGLTAVGNPIRISELLSRIANGLRRRNATASPRCRSLDFDVS